VYDEASAMLATVHEVLPLLRCPRTKNTLQQSGDLLITYDDATGRSIEYRIVGGMPVLIDFSDSVISEEVAVSGKVQSPIERRSYDGIKKFIRHLLSPHKKSTRHNVQKLIEELTSTNPQSRLLVVGGGSIGQGMEPLYQHKSLNIFGFDVYASPHVQFVADAHHIPLADGCFDAVVVQAVLEHVLQPAQVVAEIWRVLRPNGLVYAETPFMQQVHEGAYDFTRFTQSGHRYLFRQFDCISSGAVDGPGTQFMWAADYLARSIFRSVKAGKAAKLAFFWTQYLDKLIPPNYAEDGASGVFFFGRKSQQTMTPRDAIRYYRGAQ